MIMFIVYYNYSKCDTLEEKLYKPFYVKVKETFVQGTFVHVTFVQLTFVHVTFVQLTFFQVNFVQGISK